MIAPDAQPPDGSEHYREGWRDGYDQARIDRERATPAAALAGTTTPADADDAPWYQIGSRSLAHHVRLLGPNGVLTTDCGTSVDAADIADPRPAQLLCKVCERGTSAARFQPYQLPDGPPAVDLDAALLASTPTADAQEG